MLQSVLRFWLELGVSGFRVDAAPHILEDELLRDEPRSQDETARDDEYAYLNHVHTHGLPGVYDIIAAFRRTLDEHAANSDSEPRSVYQTLTMNKAI
jgi:glycosidase